MDANFDRAFNFTIGVEGGYVDNPNDPGGETNFGISKRSYPNLDIKNLTLDQAKAIYLADYWNAAHCGSMIFCIALSVFDMAVHSGVRASILNLQTVMGCYVDGEIGPETLAAITPNNFAKYNACRILNLNALSKSRVFSLGWTVRVVKLVAYISSFQGGDHEGN